MPTVAAGASSITVTKGKKDGNGNVVWESGSNRSITAPASSTGTADTSVYTWQ